MGMKRRKDERYQRLGNVYQVNNACEAANICMAPKSVVKRKKVMHLPQVDIRGIATILFMLLGIALVILSFVESYFMTYPESYSQYIVMNMDENILMLIGGFISFMIGLRLGLTSS